MHPLEWGLWRHLGKPFNILTIIDILREIVGMLGTPIGRLAGWVEFCVPVENRITTKAKENDMPAIRIYESALCCDTGVCGPDMDQSLVEVTANVRHLQGLGADIARHNLASEPTAFVEDETVRGFMHVVGSKGLPLTLVDGVTVTTGTYPSRGQLLTFAGLGDATEEQQTPPELGLTETTSGGCCGGSMSSC